MSTAAEYTGDLVLELARHSRLLHMMKNRMSSAVPAGLDFAAFGVLITLVKCGPRRQGELADFALLDPSTVSRYVAQLVRAGFVSRRPDPADGRAVQLVATEQGRALAEEATARRRALIDSLIADWPPEDAQTLVRLLRRLNDEMEGRKEGHEPTWRVAGA